MFGPPLRLGGRAAARASPRGRLGAHAHRAARHWQPDSLLGADRIPPGFIRPVGGARQRGTLAWPLGHREPGEGPRGPRRPPADLVAPTFGAQVSLGSGYGEPNVVTDGDDRVFVTPIDHVYRSVDGGLTFGDLGTSKTKGHGDGSTATDAQGNLYWLGLDLGGSGGQVPFQASRDHGETFTQAIDLAESHATDREWIDATPNGTLYTTWRADTGLMARTSRDGGATWGPLVKVTHDVFVGQVVHDPSQPSRVYIPIDDYGTGTLGIARSDDSGASWTVEDIGSDRNGVGDGFSSNLWPVMAVDDAGTLYYAISIKQDTLPPTLPKDAYLAGVYLWVSDDHGRTWTAPRLMSTPGKDAVFPWMVAGNPGRVAMDWYENTYGLPHETLPDEWNVMLAQSVTADRPDPVWMTTKASATSPHLGTVCGKGSGCLAGDRSLLDFLGIALRRNGLPVLAWADNIYSPGVQAFDTNIDARTVVAGTPMRDP